MKFGELTIAQILLSAFSGIAVLFISWMAGKKIIGRFKNKEKKAIVIQKNNRVNGNLVGGNIVKTDMANSMTIKRDTTSVDQSNNTVGGDIVGGDILKKD